MVALVDDMLTVNEPGVVTAVGETVTETVGFGATTAFTVTTLEGQLVDHAPILSRTRR